MQTHATATLSSVQVVIRATRQVAQVFHYNLLFWHLISAGEISCTVAHPTINIIFEKLEKKFSLIWKNHFILFFSLKISLCCWFLLHFTEQKHLMAHGCSLTNTWWLLSNRIATLTWGSGSLNPLSTPPINHTCYYEWYESVDATNLNTQWSKALLQ